jgi:hypothetical protein
VIREYSTNLVDNPATRAQILGAKIGEPMNLCTVHMRTPKRPSWKRFDIRLCGPRRSLGVTS